MLQIIREDLINGPKHDQEVSRYDELTLFTGNMFIKHFAETEANKRPDIQHIAQIGNEYILVNNSRQNVARFKGYWS